MEPTNQSKPQFQDITLYDQDTGEPFIFSAKEQEFFWKQGFTNVPRHSPERRKMLREQRYKGKEVYNVTCAECKRVGKILQQPVDPRKVFCENCFSEKWDSYMKTHPQERVAYEAAVQKYNEETKNELA